MPYIDPLNLKILLVALMYLHISPKSFSCANNSSLVTYQTIKMGNISGQAILT